MATPCNSTRTKIPAQTLFLGASISDFSINMGWGGQSSQLNVTLIEDTSPVMCKTSGGQLIDPFSGNIPTSFDEDNHYHTCTSDETCYMDEQGRQFNLNQTPPSVDRIVPGKVYYHWDTQNNNGFISRYWRHQDPGFFGTQTAIDINGIYNANNYSTSKGFDIINVPVFFKIGDFSFSGLVQSWERDISSGGLVYRVNIESIDSILNNAYIILGGYSGAVFSKFSGAAYGSPKNYTGTNMVYNGKIIQGNLPNIFNVYGFLESMGLESFGAAYRNENGISAVSVIHALSVLTSSVPSTGGGNGGGGDLAQALVQENKRAFSPFGRIVLKVAQDNNTFTRFSATPPYAMGLIPPTLDVDGVERSHFALDLSEMPLPPADYRLQENVISIMDFVSNVCEASGVDFYFDMLTVPYNSQPYHVIKLRTVNRKVQPALNQIQNTLKAFADDNFPMSSATLGKEKSDSSPRVLYMGGKQQRLYQAKSYRLGFARANYVWNPVDRAFVDFTSYDFGKFRAPTGYSTRNPTLSTTINGTDFEDLLNADEVVRRNLTGMEFTDDDTIWSDANLSGSAYAGNYLKTQEVKRQNTSDFNRFFPLFQDVICPFFGHHMDETIPANTSTTDNNDFRIVRPVYLDTWTGQIVFVMSIADLPTNLNVRLESLYNNNMLIITETEIRAAMNGVDSYMTYGMGKIFKPDIILMLSKAYASRGAQLMAVGEEDQGFLKFPSLGEQYNASNEVGALGPPVPQPSSSDINFDLFLNPNLVKDLHSIVRVIADIGSTYYGKKYMVRVPELVSYRDQQYSNFNVAVGSQTISVFKGSGKIFYNYEPTNDGAWEEPGNIVDDTLLVGTPKYYILCDDTGKINPILGYNVSDSFDYVSRAICGISVISAATYYVQSYNGSASEGDRWRNGAVRYDMKVLFDAARAGACDDNKFYFLSIDMSSLSPDEYVIVDSPVALKKPYTTGGTVPLDKSKKMYVKASVDEEIVYLKPKTMEEPRIIISSNSDVTLATTSYMYQTDPNLMVVSNIAIEDLLLYLKMASPPYDENFIRFMAHYMSPILGNTTLLVNDQTTTNSVRHSMLAPKAAHPYFAGIPIKSNQYTYGPWTNYPYLFKDDIFPGLSSDKSEKAVENMIAGVKVEVKEDYVPWNYGSMSLLDSVALKEIQDNANYQQILETARIESIGLPIFGLGSPFIYAAPGGYNALSINNQLFTPSLVPYTYTQKRYQPNSLANIPIVGELVAGPNLSSRAVNSTDLNYNTLILTAQYPNTVAPIVSNIQCSISPQQVRTTYNFRTYTRKLGLFNKENADRIRAFAAANIKRNKELATQSNKVTNRINKEIQQRLSGVGDRKDFGSKDLKSGLYGTSPTEILAGRALPFWPAPYSKQKSIKQLNEARKTARKNARNGNDNSTNTTSVVPYTINMVYGKDPGDDSSESTRFAATNTNESDFDISDNPARTTIRNARWSTYVGIYQPKELAADLLPEFSLKSAMSLDGIFSPVSFYPTKFYSTYPLRKYSIQECPYCDGTFKIKDQAYINGDTTQVVEYQCPYCSADRKGLSTTATTTASQQSLEILPPYIVTNKKDINLIKEFGSSSSVSSASTTSSTSSGSSGQDIAINMVSLQPIVVPYGEFRNFNANINDKCRHSIEIVAHGETPPQKQWGINTRWNFGKYIKSDGKLQNNETELGSGYNADYFYKDLLNADPNRRNKLNNQRFFGLRGPIVYHAWGYDLEGYPVPNAADEPYKVDGFGRPKRFKLTESVETTTVKFKDLKNGDMFVIEGVYNNRDPLYKQDYYYKTPGMSVTINGNITPMEPENVVRKCKLENDMTDPGGYTDAYLGDIISKTQTWDQAAGKWSDKKKLKEFYRNWAEHPNLWKVGPIDLRWDDSRGVWTTKSSDAMTIYKMVYVTLEEDLTKSTDYDETYPARGFLDDLEYSAEKLPSDSRRLVFVKDRGGYTAPRGAKLLCRYDKDSGFYEPVSKQTFIVGGVVTSGNTATIEMSYIQGRKKGEPVLTSLITYNDPFEFAPRSGQKGLFTFMNGVWTLTTAKPS